MAKLSSGKICNIKGGMLLRKGQLLHRKQGAGKAVLDRSAKKAGTKSWQKLFGLCFAALEAFRLKQGQTYKCAMYFHKCCFCKVLFFLKGADLSVNLLVLFLHFERLFLPNNRQSPNITDQFREDNSLLTMFIKWRNACVVTEWSF